MKSFIVLIVLFFSIETNAQQLKDTSGRVIIVTIDGLRWQEIFSGADENIIHDPTFTSDSLTAQLLFGGASDIEKRSKLMPFLWNVVSKQGQLFGNRLYGNNVNVANIYSVSYPGYSEMFTGKTDITIANNKKIGNPNSNIFEYLSQKENFKDRIGIFTSWDVVPFILNKKRTQLAMNCGYEKIDEDGEPLLQAINELQDEVIEKPGTRQDMLTFITAKEYMLKHQPKLLYVGLGETDEYAHAKNYDVYLRKAAEADRIISELWFLAQTTPGYKNNTTLIITTDHGRGNGARWGSHGPFIQGSSQTWVALLGKNISPLGEIKEEGQLYQKQVAQTMAYFLGERFGRQRPMMVVK